MVYLVFQKFAYYGSRLGPSIFASISLFPFILFYFLYIVTVKKSNVKRQLMQKAAKGRIVDVKIINIQFRILSIAFLINCNFGTLF